MTLEDFTAWEEKLGLRRSVVLFVTLWMTWISFEWAAAFAYVVVVKADNNLMLAAAALIAAVTAPVTYLQVAVFKAYIESKT
jgi:hypothetical protein